MVEHVINAYADIHAECHVAVTAFDEDALRLSVMLHGIEAPSGREYLRDGEFNVSFEPAQDVRLGATEACNATPSPSSSDAGAPTDVHVAWLEPGETAYVEFGVDVSRLEGILPAGSLTVELCSLDAADGCPGLLGASFELEVCRFEDMLLPQLKPVAYYAFVSSGVGRDMRCARVDVDVIPGRAECIHDVCLGPELAQLLAD